MKTMHVSNMAPKFKSALILESLNVFPPTGNSENDISDQELVDFLGLYVAGGEL